MEEIALANAGLALLEVLLPRIQALAKSGQVPPEEQTVLRERYQKLRDAGDAAFQGPEWQTS